MEQGSERPTPAELQPWLVQAIKETVRDSALNRLRDIDSSPIWEEPLVGFADGDDPLFDRFKTAVGELHLTPREALAAALRGRTGRELPEDTPIGVVSWILPAARETKLSNRQMTAGPSQRWNHSRFQGEEFNDGLRQHVVALLEVQGYAAVAPVLTEQFARVCSIHGLASTWSERHIAYAAGHGTFSLSDGLITAKGVAHRCGSVVVGVADVAWVASPRRYSSPVEYCPYLNDGSCGACIERCPAGAIGPGGHDKDRCQAYFKTTLAGWVGRPGYIGAYVGCGLCQTKVPCESGIPPRATR
jgi:epoxyqueuosine reductase